MHRIQGEAYRWRLLFGGLLWFCGRFLDWRLLRGCFRLAVCLFVAKGAYVVFWDGVFSHHADACCRREVHTVRYGVGGRLKGSLTWEINVTNSLVGESMENASHRSATNSRTPRTGQPRTHCTEFPQACTVEYCHACLHIRSVFAKLPPPLVLALLGWVLQETIGLESMAIQCQDENRWRASPCPISALPEKQIAF